MNMLSTLSTLITEANSIESFDLGSVADQLLHCFEFTTDDVSRETIINVLSDKDHENVIALMLTCSDIRAIFMHVNDRV